ncbi:hypothetical protein NEOLEDRAFT_1162098 [Neolentinus lepideus HHB14362 ss-1]|uniref:Uncharacterized protein n=1 Tax=Neolentinus lepideus HHB14362 ss-1 TaxID=1314782 RepID=A0A165TBU7_9AGAM|nr:hypothetical protein NEOLEDRAFT_1162098 [Neolentinus lepideus HHB14362 ss-1]
MAPPVGKPSLKPKRHHFYQVLLFVLGTLFPPLAVAARFGIGGDFFLNLILTICGYIPGHVHNFYIQNIRNNKNHQRTPKWAQRYGLIDTSTIKRHQKRSEWATRYNERLPRSTLEGQAYAEGERGSSSIDVSLEGERPDRVNGGEFWRAEDEHYYGQRNGGDSASGGRWHYPANFEDTIATGSVKKKKDRKDRFARTEDAYNMPDEGRKKRKKKRRSTIGETDSTYSRRTESTVEYPEDPEGGLYSERPSRARDEPQSSGRTNGDAELLNHEF